MNYFEKYDTISREYCQLNNIISSIVKNYLKNTVGFADEAGNYFNIGKTSPNEFSWSILDNDTIQISYSVYKDRFLDSWNTEEKHIKVKYDELLKYKEYD